MPLSPRAFFGKQIAFLFAVFNPFGRLPFYPMHILKNSKVKIQTYFLASL
jgi:hypothetical protein